jgi:hypothetical protein
MLKKTLNASFALAGFSTLGQFFLLSCERRKQGDLVNASTFDLDKSCPIDINLSAQDQARRNTLKYVDKTPISTRSCDNCKLYTNAVGSALCGGCKVLPGPIHPKGYCNSWYARM